MTTPAERTEAVTEPTQAQIDEAAALFKAIRKNARSRNIEVSITIEDVKRLLAESRGRCAVSGVRFSSRRPNNSRIRPWFPSVDRMDQVLTTG